MPRQPAVSHDKTIGALLQLEGLIDKDGKVLGPSNPVWSAAATALENKLSTGYLYVFFHGNRHGVMDSYLQKHGVTTVKITRARTPSSSSASEDEDDEEEDDPSISDHQSASVKDFRIVIPAEKWHILKPIKKTYTRSDRNCNRTIEVLPPFQWEDTLIELLWNQHKVPCPYTFKHSYVYSSHDSDKFISINAVCKECGAAATGAIYSEPREGEDVIVVWKAPDTTSIPHKKKRHLTRDRRKNVGRDLQGVSASVYRRREARKTMNQGDVESPLLYNEEVLRQTKKQVRDKDLSVPTCPSAIVSLEVMKHSEPFAGSIHDISYDKFHVHYHTPSQLAVYKTHKKNQYTSTKWDASGKVAKKMKRKMRTCGNIFLYECVIWHAAYQMPVLQMLSEKHDANSLLYWINEWLRSGAPIPDEAVVDNSPAFKSALARALCGCVDVADYKTRCFNFLAKGEGTLPTCFLRLDVSHFLNAAGRWDVWKREETVRLKTFYMHTLGLLIKCKTLKDFESILTRALVIASATHDGEPDELGEKSVVQEALSTLSAMIQGSDLPSLPEDDEDSISVNESMAEDESDTCNDIRDFIERIQDRATQSLPGVEGRINPFYSPGVVKELVRLAHDFVLWTGVLVGPFNSPYETASSASVESDFSNLKRNVLKGVCGHLRADRLVATHLQHIEGSCRIAGAAQNCVEFTGSNEPTEPEIDNSVVEQTQNGPEDVNGSKESSETYLEGEEDDSDGVSGSEQGPADLNNTENWKGLGFIPKPKRKKSKYLNPFPALDNAIQHNRMKPPKYPVLQNGNLQGFTKLDGGVHVHVKNTCPYDVLAQICAGAYMNYQTYRTYVDPSTADLLVVSKNLAVNGAVGTTYQLRASALAKIISVTESVPSGITSRRRSIVQLVYDCWGVATELATSALRGLESGQVLQECTKGCQKEEIYAILPTEAEVIQEEGIGNLSKAIRTAMGLDASAKSPHLQHTCKDRKKRHYGVKKVLFNQHVFVDVDVFSAYEEDTQLFSTVPLNLIPQYLELGSCKYVLTGVVARQPPNHFVALVRSSDSRWEVFNDLKKYPSGARDDAAVSPVMFVYIKL